MFALTKLAAIQYPFAHCTTANCVKDEFHVKVGADIAREVPKLYTGRPFNPFACNVIVPGDKGAIVGAFPDQSRRVETVLPTLLVSCTASIQQ